LDSRYWSKAGENGGKVVAQGKFEDIKKANSLTGKYLSGKLKVGQNINMNLNLNVRENKKISITGVKTNNLKNITLENLLHINMYNRSIRKREVFVN
jgi:excinuclease ABC subunit A